MPFYTGAAEIAWGKKFYAAYGFCGQLSLERETSNAKGKNKSWGCKAIPDNRFWKDCQTKSLFEPHPHEKEHKKKKKFAQGRPG
jgi:hypothetical protein